MADLSELQKYEDTHEQRAVIVEFLEWLDGQRLEIAQESPHKTYLMPIAEGRQKMLDRFLGIDAAKLENERRTLLERCRRG